MNKEKWLQQYLDGELTPEEEQQALHMIADDEEMRSLLRFETILKSSFSETETSFAVPEGFANRVMHQIRSAEHDHQAQPAPSLGDRLYEVLNTIFKPRQLQIQPAYAMLVFLILLIPALLLFNQSGDPASKPELLATQVSATAPDEVLVRFVYVDKGAESIAIAGDFSDWEPITLEKQNMNDQTVWSGLVSMPRGEHRYMFVVNGEEWVTDPLASSYENDGFGNKNAVIYL